MYHNSHFALHLQDKDYISGRCTKSLDESSRNVFGGWGVEELVSALKRYSSDLDAVQVYWLVQGSRISSSRMDLMKTSKFSWYQWRIGAGADPAMTHVLRQRTRGKEQAVHGCSDAEDWLDCEVWATCAVCGKVQVENVNLLEMMSLLKFLGREMVPTCGQVGCMHQRVASQSPVPRQVTHS